MITIPEEVWRKRSGVYFIYIKPEDKEFLAYVGRSTHIIGRLGTHATSSDTYVNFENDTRIAYIPLDNKEEMMELEKICIRHFKPCWNRTPNTVKNTKQELELLRHYNLLD